MERLGLGVEDASTQIIPRDRHAELLSAIALAGAGLERFATEIRNLQRTEVREVEEPFGKGQKGSSAMPHKRNPITTERITGLARVLRGYAQAGLENVALWHERDISHSGAERVILPDATIGLDYMQHLATRVASGMTVHAERMRENLELTYGRDLQPAGADRADRRRDVRDDAYRLVQENAQRAWDTRTPFQGLLETARRRCRARRRRRRDLRPDRLPDARGRGLRAPREPSLGLRAHGPARWIGSGGFGTAGFQTRPLLVSSLRT